MVYHAPAKLGSDGKTYFGQWISEEDGARELLGIISYEEPSLGFYNPYFTLENMGAHTDELEFRIKNAYGHKVKDKSGCTGRSTPSRTPSTPTHRRKTGHETYCINIDNNIETGRHKDGYVWARVGGEVYEVFTAPIPSPSESKAKARRPMTKSSSRMAAEKFRP